MSSNGSEVRHSPGQNKEHGGKTSKAGEDLVCWRKKARLPKPPRTIFQPVTKSLWEPSVFAQQHSHQFQQIKAPSLSTLSQLLLGTYGRDCTNNKRSRGLSPPHRRSRSLAKSKTRHAAGCAEWTLLKFFQPKVGNWHAGLSRHRSRCPKFTG